MKETDESIDFKTLMTLESHGPDVFVGRALSYPWGRLYGGHVIAQALRAAYQTVDTDHRVHSLHAYFIRGGNFDEPVRYEVDRIRNGRSFLTRRVVARQSVGPILNLSASFQLAEDQADIQEATLDPEVPGTDMEPLFRTLLDTVPAPRHDPESPLRAWVTKS